MTHGHLKPIMLRLVFPSLPPVFQPLTSLFIVFPFRLKAPHCLPSFCCLCCNLRLCSVRDSGTEPPSCIKAERFQLLERLQDSCHLCHPVGQLGARNPGCLFHVILNTASWPVEERIICYLLCSFLPSSSYCLQGILGIQLFSNTVCFCTLECKLSFLASKATTIWSLRFGVFNTLPSSPHPYPALLGGWLFPELLVFVHAIWYHLFKISLPLSTLWRS